MRSAFVCLTAFILLSACQPARTGAGPRSADDGAPFGRVPAAPNGKAWLEKDATRAQSAGAGASEVLTVEAGAPGDRISSMLTVPEDRCALLVARGTDTVEDIDLYAYGEDGSVLGTDEAPDRRPTLMVCPPHPRRVFVVARVASGHGLIALGAQQVSVKDAPRVGRATGAHGHPEEAAGRLEAWPGLTERISEHRRLAGGSWQDLRKVAVPIETRVPTRVSAAVEAERCLDVLVVPSEDASHLDVSVLDESGRIIGRAAATGRDRSIIICSPIRTAITIEMRPHIGRGLAAVVLSRSVAGSERSIQAEMLRYDVAPTAELDEMRQRHNTRLTGRGYAQSKTVAQGALSIGRRSSMILELPAGCVRLDLLAGRPVRGVEAWLWSDAGQLLVNERGPGQVALFACTPGGKARLDVEAITQPGKYVVEMRVEGGTPKLLTEHSLGAGRLLANMTDRGVIQKAEQVGAARLANLSETQLYREDLLVPIGRCVDITVGLDAGASGAEIRVIDKADGRELAAGRGAFAASARVCALSQTSTRNAVAEIRTLAGQTTGVVATRMLAPKP